MARSLYRFYIYAVATALLIFAMSAFGSLLSTGLAFTSLRGSYQDIPTQAQFVQALSYACVAFLIAGFLGGLHYWLLRRDLRQEPQAANSAIRSFFLNTTEGISVAFGSRCWLPLSRGWLQPPIMVCPFSVRLLSHSCFWPAWYILSVDVPVSQRDSRLSFNVFTFSACNLFCCLPWRFFSSWCPRSDM
ncbi:DUF5671 domain-containing protein [Dictyobacter vulcani]|uniref:DUF5671 domain-containing protein n=1 Tax=Dictyobacter vulcani TaxID=2607529 RepID=UPI0012509B5A|nr:DUF5671 domain-containing protein [Dictyobacter vulcani]